MKIESLQNAIITCQQIINGLRYFEKKIHLQKDLIAEMQYNEQKEKAIKNIEIYHRCINRLSYRLSILVQTIKEINNEF